MNARKAATRLALADAALRLFLDRGYDNVTVREVADAADVAATTLLKYFPTKASLVFDRDTDIEAALIAAVTDRPAGVSILAALRAHAQARVAAMAVPGRAAFLALVRGTPALSEYAHTMWTRHQDALARAIAGALGAPEDDPRCGALARFALQASEFAVRADEPARAVDVAFDLLAHGWRAED